MQVRVYVSLQGKSFSPARFQNSVSGVVSGRIERRKHSGAPLTDVGLDYWRSEASVTSPKDVGLRLSELLERLFPFIGEVPDRSALKVFAHVVLEYDEGESPVGLYVPRRTIELLNATGADLDVDAVPRVPRP